MAAIALVMLVVSSWRNFVSGSMCEGAAQEVGPERDSYEAMQEAKLGEAHPKSADLPRSTLDKSRHPRAIEATEGLVRFRRFAECKHPQRGVVLTRSCRGPQTPFATQQLSGLVALAERYAFPTGIRDMRVYIGRRAHLVTATAMPTAITWLAST
jgi:hypothetical protein